MRIGDWIIFEFEAENVQRSTLNVQRSMSEAELNRTFASVEPNHALLVAFRQILDDAERDANRLAADELAKNNPLIVAGYTGAAQQCRDLMGEVERRRADGLKLLGISQERRKS